MFRHYKRPAICFAIAILAAAACSLTGENDCTAAIVYGFMGFADSVCKTKTLLRAYFAAEEEKNYGKNPK